MRQGTILAVYEPRQRTIIGYPSEVERALRTAHARGVLATDPATIKPFRHRNGQVAVRVDLLEPAERRVPSGPPRWLVWTLAVLAAWAALLALGWGLAYVAGPSLPDLGSVVGFLVATLFVLWLIRSVTSGHACKGIHCPDCPGRH